MIDTEIRGDPESVEGAATWLRATLAPHVVGGADVLVTARNVAHSEWDGRAGERFAHRVGQGARTVDGLGTTLRDIAGTFAQYAADLTTAQQKMATIRATARSRGLVVHGFVIQHPGPGPAPAAAPGQMTPRQADQQSQQAIAYRAHQDLLLAYDTALAAAEQVRRSYVAACERVRAAREASGALLATEILTFGTIDVLRTRHKSILASEVKRLRAEATHWSDLIDTHRGATHYPGGREALDDHVRFRDEKINAADRLSRSVDDLDSRPPLRGARVGIGGALGAATFGVGVHTDLRQGESTTQAVTSNAGGVVAGMAAGAMIGTAIPVPVLGTVVGAVAGAGVGIVASGAIDSVFENGPDVGKAIQNVRSDFSDAGRAIQDVGRFTVTTVGGLGKAIGGLFD